MGDPSQGWSREFSFKTAPLVGPDTLPYRLGVIGDLGQTDHSLRWAQQRRRCGVAGDGVDQMTVCPDTRCPAGWALSES